MRFLIIFIFLLSNSFADEVTDIKNLVINKNLKKYDNLTFLNAKKEQLDLSDYHGNLIILNFWATWCAPCKEEMPSLDTLKVNPNLNNLEIFPINIGRDSLKKSKIFFDEIDIKNLKIYFDNSSTLAKDLSLRGIPTTVIFNKEGKEFAKIIGYIDFNDKEFINWLSSYN